MSRVIRFYETGGPEVLKLEQAEVGAPGPGQARVRHSYVAVNFIDIYFRTGRYPLPLPNGLGSDAAGVVEATAGGVAAEADAASSGACKACRTTQTRAAATAAPAHASSSPREEVLATGAGATGCAGGAT